MVVAAASTHSQVEETSTLTKTTSSFSINNLFSKINPPKNSNDNSNDNNHSGSGTSTTICNSTTNTTSTSTDVTSSERGTTKNSTPVTQCKNFIIPHKYELFQLFWSDIGYFVDYF
eukprot:Awhi_evm1s3387